MDKAKVKLAIAPIAWTNDDLPELGAENTFEQCISEMALAGFTGSEIGNKYPKDVNILKHKLDVRGLQICNSWFSSFFTTREEEETLSNFIKQRDFLHTLGAKMIGVSEQGLSIQGLSEPIFASKPIFSDEHWDRLTKGLNKLSSLAAEKDMKVSYHSHMGTGVQTSTEIDRLMNMVNNDVYLLFDSGHVYHSEGEQQAVENVLTKYISRIKHVHLKDVRGNILSRVKSEGMSFLDGVREGVFTIPGDGVIDFTNIFKILHDNEYEGWLVVEAEQDPNKANPFEYALRARKFITEHTGL